mmetsp:Transcript_15258/g.32768  ORF Transcript_15258/g.32768 Transcript_15258/m.32768 type:complete len:94 (-) Transcript_15258:508-789(-)
MYCPSSSASEDELEEIVLDTSEMSTSNGVLLREEVVASASPSKLEELERVNALVTEANNDLKASRCLEILVSCFGLRGPATLRQLIVPSAVLG